MKINLHTFQLISTLIFGLYYPKTQAQTPIDNYTFQQFTTEHGLSNNTVYDMLKDRRGYVWLATPSGLNRFDGYNFKVYRHSAKDTNSIADDLVLCLLETRDGTMWVGTGDGFMRYDTLRDNFRHYSTYNRDADKYFNKRCLAKLYKMAEDPFSGDIWLSLECGFARFNRKTEQCTFFEIPTKYTDWRQNKTNLAASGFLFENDTTTWIISQYGLHRHNPKSGRFQSFIITEYPKFNLNIRDANIMTFVCQDPSVSQRLWLGTWGNGLVSFDKRTGKFRVFKTHPNRPINGMNNIFFSGCFLDNYTLLMTGDDFWVFSTKDNTFKTYQPLLQNGLSKKENNGSIYFDRDSNLWVFNSTKGFSVSYRQNQQFGLQSIPQPFAIRAILRGRDSSLFFSNVYINRGLSTLYPRSNKFEFKLLPLLNERGSGASQILEDDDGDLWMGNNLGLFQYKRKSQQLTERIIRLSNGQLSSHSGCRTLAYDNHGQIWVRIEGDVSIYRLNPHTNADTLIEKDAGNFMQSAFSKEIICLTHHDGIKIWSSGGQLIETYNHPKLNVYIDYAYHHQITTDSKGRIWLGAHNGLISFERGANWQNTIRQWTTENGLPSNTIYDMAGDPRGGAWVIAEGGLVYVDTIGQLTIYNFNRNVLPDWKNVGIQIDAKGEAFIKADMNYYYQFHTDQIRPLSIAATQIAFNDFRLFGKPISLEKDINYLSEISLNHNQNTFSVVFGAVGCLESEALRYSYRLVGLDTNWIDNGNNRYVAFSNLEPRAYELQVRVSAVFGQWSDEYKSLKINIQPAIWQTLSFKIIAWAAFIGLLILGVRLYVRQQIRTERRRQEAIERERERIFDEIHDELGSYLTRIKYKADNIVNDFVTMNLTTLHTAVTNLSNITIDALERMNDIIQEIRAPDDSLHNFTADLRAWVIGVCNDAHINCRCAIPPLEDKLLIGMVRHNLLLTVKQALRNTTQHASASAVIISIQCKDNLEIIIQDNGKGFNPATVKNQSSGLRSMHKRMNKIGGTIEIQSTIGVGTTIRLSVPIHT